MTYRYIFSYNTSMENGIIIQDFNGVVSEIPLNSKEMQLALDKSNPDASWSLMCDSVNYRIGIDIIGNYNLQFIIVKGQKRPLH